MYRFTTWAVAIAVSVGTSAMLSSRKPTQKPTRNLEASFAADGAFRDGLYLGKPSEENLFVP